MHDEDADVEDVQLELGVEEKGDDLGDVGYDHEEPDGVVELRPEGPEAAGGDGLVELLPEDEVLVALGMRVAVRDDVEFSSDCLFFLFCFCLVVVVVEGLLGDDEAVAVVVDVGEADAIEAVAEDAELSVAGVFEDVRQEEVVAGPVDLVGRDGDGLEAVAVRLGDLEFRHGLGFRVGLQILFERELRQFVLGQPVDVRPREPRRGRAGEHEFLHLEFLAGLENV
mmetsp:Transcript_29263/g.94400  ORF Transcript_29263/g.94400 Transcript_29263/m.94400 type:complete len:225 (-) Transcript_29263:394-1068(-)